MGMMITMTTTKPTCTCGHICCVCDILRDHKEGCQYRRSVTCAVPIECEHGRDVCPICDECTCWRLP
jgi:hypothetical protein